MWLGAMAGVPPHHRDHGLGNLLVSRHREHRAPQGRCGEAGHHGGQGASSPAFLCPRRGENGAGAGWERVGGLPCQVGFRGCIVTVHEGLGVTFPPSSLGLSFPSEFEKRIGSERSF